MKMKRSSLSSSVLVLVVLAILASVCCAPAEAQAWCKYCWYDVYGQPICLLADGPPGPFGYIYCWAYPDGCVLQEMCSWT